jgi:SAM-dependent methyltransferase
MAAQKETKPHGDRHFAGPIPRIYDRLLVPMLFTPYALQVAARIDGRKASAVLEIAAGTGAVTRALADRLPSTTAIVATDLNQAMLDEAARIGTKRPVVWQRVDALELPFDDQSFDAVVCQFGVMFFPDRVRAYAQVRRVLQAGGVFVFNAWNRIETNDFPNVVQSALIDLYPDDPPRFMARVPHGYFDAQIIREDLTRAGFSAHADITTVSATSHGVSARAVAEAFCQGTPLRTEIEARGPDELVRATEAAEAALVQRFGAGPLEGALSALLVEVVA